MIPKIKMSFLLTEQKKMNENVLRKDFLNFVFMFIKSGKLRPKNRPGSKWMIQRVEVDDLFNWNFVAVWTPDSGPISLEMKVYIKNGLRKQKLYCPNQQMVCESVRNFDHVNLNDK